jgi:hypothetical protein
LNHPVCLVCQYFMSGSKLLDGITLYVQLVSISYLVQNFWMELPCMFKLSVLHVWFKTFRWKPPVCSTCLLHVWIPSKRFESDMKYWQIEHTGWFNTKALNQTWSTDKLNIQGDSIQNFWTKHEVDKLNIQGVSKNFRMESSCMLNLSVLHVWFKTFGWNHPVCSTC